MVDERKALEAAAGHYRRAAEALDEAREQVKQAVLAALRAGVGPSEVERIGPFTGAHVRKIARENGVPAAPRGLKPRRKAG